jgi:hypothetical protein
LIWIENKNSSNLCSVTGSFTVDVERRLTRKISIVGFSSPALGGTGWFSNLWRSQEVSNRFIVFGINLGYKQSW